MNEQTTRIAIGALIFIALAYLKINDVKAKKRAEEKRNNRELRLRLALIKAQHCIVCLVTGGGHGAPHHSEVMAEITGALNDDGSDTKNQRAFCA